MYIDDDGAYVIKFCYNIFFLKLHKKRYLTKVLAVNFFEYYTFDINVPYFFQQLL